MTISRPVTGSFVAGEEYQLTIIGFQHPGTMRVSICYENCQQMESYEDYILGYWWREGTAGPNSNIYGAVVNVTVKMPNRNCDNCILQMLADADDVRSYVSCADISITGASGDDTFYQNNDFISQVGVTDFCGNCASNGCPLHCGG